MNRTLSKILAAVFFLALSTISYSQVANDECLSATLIPDVTDYCSDANQFNNFNATASPQANPSCFPQNSADKDVWFSFVPRNLGMFVQITGETVLGQGTLVSPQITLYTGDCVTGLVEEACTSVLVGDNVNELTLTDVKIGATYYLRVAARDGNEGDFRLCIQTFSPVKEPEADCPDGVILCNKDPFFVESLQGSGVLTNEVPNSCIREEFASVWYKWTCKDPGSLTFILSPNNSPDDLDFAVYRLPGGLDDCNNKELLRCMASGETIGNSAALNSPCFGDTGLGAGSTDIEETPGCSPGDDNFVAALDMVAGESYALIINNFSQSGFGFSIEWGGTGTFLGPEADFEIEALQAFECDKTINFINKSESTTDPIVNYVWSFGDGADLSSSNDFGPHDIIYDSFGDKTAALTVESSKGCLVTKIVEFFVEPCCADTTGLSVTGTGEDPLCPGIASGEIEAMGMAGSPRYFYNINGSEFGPSNQFGGLPPGTFELGVQDRKGCESFVTVVLEEPDSIMVDAGEDQEIVLGDSLNLDGTFFPLDDASTFAWSPPDGIRDLESLTSIVQPFRTQTYTLTVENEDGCIEDDEVTIRVKIERPLLAPNIISPDSRNENSYFNIFGNNAIKEVEKLMVFDRWGNKVYQGIGIPHSQYFVGWDGTFNGQEVAEGVYAFLAKVRYIDDVVIEFAGDVTVIR